MTRLLTVRTVCEWMTRTLAAATIDAPGILDAGALARIGGSFESLLIGVIRPLKKDDHKAHQRGNDKQDFFHDAPHNYFRVLLVMRSGSQDSG